MNKEIREKCLKAGVVPLQGLNEALFAIHSSILIGKAWSKYNKIKIFNLLIRIIVYLKLILNMIQKKY